MATLYTHKDRGGLYYKARNYLPCGCGHVEVVDYYTKRKCITQPKKFTETGKWKFKDLVPVAEGNL